jgi:hypothetical protein
MKNKVQEILQRELSKLDTLSQTTGLDLNDFKRLDLLIKAYQTFAGQVDNKNPTSSSLLSSQSTQAIVDELLKSNDGTE